MISKLKIFKNKIYHEEFKKLKKEKRFFDLQELYNLDSSEINSFLKEDFENITGEKFNYKNRKKYKITRCHDYKRITFMPVVLLTGFLAFDSVYYQNRCLTKATFDSILLTASSIMVSSDTHEYDQKLKEDYSDLDIKNMSDLEVIMRVLYDIRSNTYYDSNVNENAQCGFNYRLYLNDDNNHGVCRHIEDKFTAAINSVYPDYHAVNMIVNFDVSIPYYKSILKGEINEEHIPTYISSYNINDKKNRYGNHILTILKAREGDYYLVVDATNPSIGVLENGEIHMFNSDSTDSMKYNSLGQYFLVSNGSNLKLSLDRLYSINHDIDYTELEKKYGFDAQVKQLKLIENEKTLNN